MLETLLNIYADLFIFLHYFFFFLIRPTLFLHIKILLPPAKVAQRLENTGAKSPSTHTTRAEAHAVPFARLQSQRRCAPHGKTHSCLASR